jgi:methylthioxylose transferase
VIARGAAETRRRIADRGAVAIGVALGLVALAYAGGRWLRSAGYRMQVNAPPLTGNLDPRLGITALPAALVGAAGAWWGVERARRLPWRGLLAVAFAAALAWAAALAAWDGVAGFTRSSLSGVDYLQAVPMIGAHPGAFLRGFAANVGSFPAHVRAHPPGLVLVLWAMDRAGLGGAWWASSLQLVAGAASVPAALLALREVAGERAARAAAPFLVLSTAAVFWSSGDAVFLGVGAWAAASVVLATGRRGLRSIGLALAGGVLLGLGGMLSYGLVLMAAVPLGVAIVRRRPAPLAVAAVVAVAVVAGISWSLGWSWLQGLGVTRTEYAASLARIRPYPYFVWANLAAFAVVLGPAVWVALSRLRDRRAWWLIVGAIVAVAIADLSGFSKGEVERIWLPFAPWIVLATAAFEDAEGARGWLGLQVVWTLLVQWAVRSPW